MSTSVAREAARVSHTDAPAKRPGRKSGALRRGDTRYALLLILPAVAVLSLVIAGPLIRAIWSSFQNDTLTGSTGTGWNDFGNYKQIFSSGEIYTYLRNTGVFVVGSVGAQLVLGMGLALLLNSSIRGQRFFRTLFMIPWVIPGVVVALLWSWLLQPQYGVANYLLSHIGLVSADQQWTLDPHLAMLSVISAAVWRETPITLLLILAGLQGVPEEHLEAALVDGASWWRRLWHIVLPWLRPVIATAATISVINGFQSFTLIYNITQGGPLNKTTTLSVGTYEEAFRNYNFGVGSAIGVIWMLVLLLVAAVALRLSGRRIS